MESDCFICRKHHNLREFTGEVIAESGGLIVTHFPLVSDEKSGRGHLIIEPRRHITDLTEMNDAEAAALGLLARKATLAIKAQLGAAHVYMFRINDKVAHLHFHLVPRFADTPRDFWGLKIMAWPGRQSLTLNQIQELSLQLRQKISVATEA